MTRHGILAGLALAAGVLGAGVLGAGSLGCGHEPTGQTGAKGGVEREAAPSELEEIVAEISSDRAEIEQEISENQVKLVEVQLEFAEFNTQVNALLADIEAHPPDSAQRRAARVAEMESLIEHLDKLQAKLDDVEQSIVALQARRAGAQPPR